MKTKIALTMIAKNEAHVIERAIRSAVPMIDGVVLIDTGSTDDTILKASQAAICNPDKELTFCYRRIDWRGFADARNASFEMARRRGFDYALWLDADDVITGAYPIKRLAADAYTMTVRYANLAYERAHLVSLKKPWRWAGVVHEGLYLDDPGTTEHLRGVEYKVVGGGARSRDPEKFAKDAVTIEQALAGDPDNTRLHFYYAQSLRDSGQLDRALWAYIGRAMMGGWDEEKYVALLEAARLQERIDGGQTAAAVGRYEVAANFRPQRAEAWVELARCFRERGEHTEAFVAANKAVAAENTDRLFVDIPSHGWRGWDELALACFHLGDFDTARETWVSLLEVEGPDGFDRARFEAMVRACGVAA